VTPPSSTPEGNADGASYGIQIASFESADRAILLTQLLAEVSIPARTIERNLREGGRWYQVFAGGYPSLESAQADLDRIHSMPGYADARVVRIATEAR
jgi:hypothetical protein